MFLPLAVGLSEGLTAISSVFEFMSSNSVLSVMLSVAIGGVVLSVAMGIFFRSR